MEEWFDSYLTNTFPGSYNEFNNIYKPRFNETKILNDTTFIVPITSYDCNAFTYSRLYLQTSTSPTILAYTMIPDYLNIDSTSDDLVNDFTGAQFIWSLGYGMRGGFTFSNGNIDGAIIPDSNSMIRNDPWWPFWNHINEDGNGGEGDGNCSVACMDGNHDPSQHWWMPGAPPLGDVDDDGEWDPYFVSTDWSNIPTLVNIYNNFFNGTGAITIPPGGGSNGTVNVTGTNYGNGNTNGPIDEAGLDEIELATNMLELRVKFGLSTDDIDFLFSIENIDILANLICFLNHTSKPEDEIDNLIKDFIDLMQSNTLANESNISLTNLIAQFGYELTNYIINNFDDFVSGCSGTSDIEQCILDNINNKCNVSKTSAQNEFNIDESTLSGARNPCNCLLDYYEYKNCVSNYLNDAKETVTIYQNPTHCEINQSRPMNKAFFHATICDNCNNDGIHYKSVGIRNLRMAIQTGVDGNGNPQMQSFHLAGFWGGSENLTDIGTNCCYNWDQLDVAHYMAEAINESRTVASQKIMAGDLHNDGNGNPSEEITLLFTIGHLFQNKIHEACQPGGGVGDCAYDTWNGFFSHEDDYISSVDEEAYNVNFVNFDNYCN